MPPTFNLNIITQNLEKEIVIALQLLTIAMQIWKFKILHNILILDY